ncbi:hypothetical protein B0E47_00140 [Rhodanobacter sp. B05]|uniref:hypothetical protein n=1 Tax=Rhodanobacter sp. B05 TaxID=1945859 RepID=UPI0009857AC9|nr:hypothetical protein [Rhodanobacter sp. B05]OOG61123.1 hypothetical protein B0E47_00140 [Rhodanobacter sp. B05]
MVIVVTSAFGNGKSSFGQALAATPGWDFLEGDDMHPPSNVEEIRAGTALDDSDRRLDQRQPDHARRALQHVKAQMRFELLLSWLIAVSVTNSPLAVVLKPDRHGIPLFDQAGVLRLRPFPGVGGA